MVLRRVSYVALATFFVVGSTLLACSSDSGGGTGGGGDAGNGGDDGGSSATDSGGGGQDSGGGGNDSGGGGQDSGGDSGGGTVTFGNPCQTPNAQSDCAPGLTCRSYPNKSANLCTKTCSVDGDCPAPSNKCGGAKYCAFP